MLDKLLHLQSLSERQIRHAPAPPTPTPPQTVNRILLPDASPVNCGGGALL